MNVRMADGTARCAEHIDGQPQGVTNDACIYCEAEELHDRPVEPEPITEDTCEKCGAMGDVFSGWRRLFGRLYCVDCLKPVAWFVR